MEIFKLFGSIMVDSTEANKSISSTSQEAEGLGSKLSSGIASAAKWAAGVATAAASVGTAMVAAAKDAADSLGDIDDAAQRIGVDAETMQELQYVAEMSGMELSDLEKAAKKLEGTDLNLDQAIDEIMSLGTAEEQTQKAIELFGESVAYNMQPLLNQGADGIEAFKQQAHDLGIVMSNETVEAGASFGDMFEALSSSFESMKTGLMSELMPYAMEIMQWLMDNLPMIQETISTVMDTVIPIVQPVLDLLMKLIPPIFDKIKELLDWLTPYLEPIMDAVVGVVEGIMKLLDGDIDGFIVSVKDALIGLGKALFNIGKDIMNYLWNGIKSVWTTISNWVSEKVSWIKDKLTFWKKSQSEMDTDGSHASGLNYVPYDGYIAELHKGEMVANAGTVQSLMSALTNSQGSSQPLNITVQSVLDGKVIGESVYKYTNTRKAMYGI